MNPQTPDPDEVAKQSVELRDLIVSRLGAEFIQGSGDSDLEVTPEGDVAFHIRDMRLFQDENGDLVASRERDGEVEFSTVDAEGGMEWTAAPSDDPNAN